MSTEPNNEQSSPDRNEVFELVRDQLADILELEPSAINESSSFVDDLDADSLALIELVEGLEEELSELKEAVNNKDINEIADALTDILYVTYGAGHAYGINLDKCFDEVQNSNMSKLGEDGKPIYNESGKVMKGPNYFKPNLKKFL